jgi:signal transduction histidine kinase
MVEAIPDELFRQDQDGVYLDVHSKDPTLPFWPREAMIGQRMDGLLGSEVAEKRLGAIQRALGSGEVQVLEYSLHHQGDSRDFEARVVPYAPGETITIVRDITDRNLADRLKREFVSTVSHELRTPLTAIRGALGLLSAQREALPPGTRELADIADRNSQRLLGLVNDILDLDKVEQGTLDIQMEVHAILPLVRQAVEALRPYAQGLGVDFHLCAGAEGAAKVDSARLLQVLTNLLGNAAKFSPKGEPVQVRLARAGSRLRLEVENGGPGIPPAFRPRIFQKFAQADASDARRYPGTGLGLAISKALVERMGGEIGFESEPGRTVFFVAFAAEESA